jgi:hypothetical protein
MTAQTLEILGIPAAAGIRPRERGAVMPRPTCMPNRVLQVIAARGTSPRRRIIFARFDAYWPF